MEREQALEQEESEQEDTILLLPKLLNMVIQYKQKANKQTNTDR